LAFRRILRRFCPGVFEGRVDDAEAASHGGFI